MRVYISGPITGAYNYKENFKKAEEKLKADGYEVVNPVAFDSGLPQLNYEEYMKLDLCLLSVCDAIYMLRGWKQSCGANREYGYAQAKNYIIMEE